MLVILLLCTTLFLLCVAACCAAVIHRQLLSEWKGEVRLCFKDRSYLGVSLDEPNTWYVASDDCVTAIFLAGAWAGRLPIITMLLREDGGRTIKQVFFTMKWYTKGTAILLSEEVSIEPGDHLELRIVDHTDHTKRYIICHVNCRKGASLSADF